LNLLKNMSIKSKMLFVVLVVIFFDIISVFDMYFIEHINSNLNEIVDSESQKIILVYQVKGHLAEVNRIEKNLLIVTTKAEMGSLNAISLRNETELGQKLSQLRNMKLQESNQILINEFEIAWKTYIELLNQIDKLIKGLTSGATDDYNLTSLPDYNKIYSEAVSLSKNEVGTAYGKTSLLMDEVVTNVVEELSKRKLESDRNSHRAILIAIFLSALSILIGLYVGISITRSIATGLITMVNATDNIAKGDLETLIEIKSNDEIGKLAEATQRMQISLQAASKQASSQDWIKTGLMKLNEVIQGELELTEISNKIITEIANYLEAKIGAIYLTDTQENSLTLKLTGSYAYQQRKNLSNRFRSGEGLVGQAALEKTAIVIKNVPEDYIKITSGLGESLPQYICVIPFLFENRVEGVLEIGTLHELNTRQLEYLDQAVGIIAINIETARNRDELASALEKAQMLTEELQSQQEELKTTNEELEEQTVLLQQSEERLKAQQEELEVSNEELEEKNESLQRQKREIEEARKEVEQKAEQLTIASKYKSEFLANMSHELRTPLNSLLILSSMLADNKEGNLTDSQQESAEVINKSGKDLLQLINEILDLSKIEAGRMDINIEKIPIQEIADSIRNNFKHMLDEKGLAFEIKIDSRVPEYIMNDNQRLHQIIKNLMSNAIKFTKQGGITVEIKLPAENTKFTKSGLQAAKSFAISITDSGIGIPVEKQLIIFEAFQQAEGGTSREYGGTGLGLSISRELSMLLGGEIHLVSTKGKGSTFTLYLPIHLESPPTMISSKSKSSVTPYNDFHKYKPLPRSEITLADDRDKLDEDKQSILIIEDDTKFAKLLLDQCREKGFSGLTAVTGEAGLELAAKYQPSAIILDLHLPGIDGWAVLDTLKNDAATRHIPVHIMSVEDSTIEAFRKGAIGYLTKPVKKEELDEAFLRLEGMFSRRIKDLLIVEDNKNLRDSIVKLIGNGDVHCHEAETGSEVISELQSHRYDCMILDLGLPDMTGFELLKTLEQTNAVIPPVIVYTGKELSREEELELHNYAESIIIKGVKSQERLLDETSLFLHRMVDKLPEQKRKMIANLHDTEVIFKDKKILIVDDDMRNVFALSKILSDKGFNLLKAENGLKALAILKTETDVDLVLMDIMMPEMDGYEAIRRIRAQERYSKLPIIALTAKAMKKDYEDSIAAGASDYMSKPVDITRLFSMLRVWLYR